VGLENKYLHIYGFTYMVVKTLTDILLEKLRQEVNSEIKIGNFSAIKIA
jgi:hypothetical protein